MLISSIDANGDDFDIIGISIRIVSFYVNSMIDITILVEPNNFSFCLF